MPDKHNNHFEIMKLQTYIINLKTSTARRDYMEKTLKPYDFLVTDYIEAIDGRRGGQDYLNEHFNYQESFKRYGRKLNQGEVGCALSHRKCYEALLKSNNNCALILEDDITVIRDLNIIADKNFDAVMDTPKPTILFLSGDYWFWNARNGIAKVFTGVGAYAYIINKPAAEALLKGKAFTVADDWDCYKERRIKYYAVFPYIIDANLNMDSLSTDVKQDSWGIDKTKMGLYYLTKYLIDRVIKFSLGLCKHFESKIRVINNVIVDN